MTKVVDNIELDKDNVEFDKAADFVHHTDKFIYLTGRAGTGKTTFLKYIKDTTDKNVVVLAPTGVAAINAGGVTIHSFFQIPLGPFVPDDARLRTSTAGGENQETIYTTFKYKEEKRKIIENLELLIIDEVSMVRADTLDVIDKILRVFRRKQYLAFGGVQVILIGDTFQLPPVTVAEQRTILSRFYNTPYFFSSKVVEQNTPIYIELKKIYRQSEMEFIDLLNRVRVNKVTYSDLQMLNSKYKPTFSGDGRDYIILATHNQSVNETNLRKLNELKTELFTYKANVTGVFPDKLKPTDHYLKLKVGAQIMFIKNDAGSLKRYYNGKIGKITELDESSITVVFDDDSEVEVERAQWRNVKYTYNKEKGKIEEELLGTFEQFPIRLAWAITVHKSQGMTFEKVIADLGHAFAPGQVYVALSRCTSFSGLVLKTRLTSSAIKTDPRVIKFAQKETPGMLITEQLKTGRADYYYRKAREDFRNGNIKSAFDFFKRALMFRNDIDTDEFKKFIEVQGKSLFHSKQMNSALIAKLEQVRNERLKAKKNSELLTEELEKLKRHFNKLNARLQEKESDLRAKNIEIRANKAEIQASKKEIRRLKNLKWYDKLFGKK